MPQNANFLCSIQNGHAVSYGFAHVGKKCQPHQKPTDTNPFLPALAVVRHQQSWPRRPSHVLLLWGQWSRRAGDGRNSLSSCLGTRAWNTKCLGGSVHLDSQGVLWFYGLKKVRFTMVYRPQNMAQVTSSCPFLRILQRIHLFSLLSWLCIGVLTRSTARSLSFIC